MPAILQAVSLLHIPGSKIDSIPITNGPAQFNAFYPQCSGSNVIPPSALRPGAQRIESEALSIARQVHPPQSPIPTYRCAGFGRTDFCRCIRWRDSTRSAVLFTMNQHVLPAFGDVPLAKLRRFDLQTHVNKIAANYSKSLVEKVRTWVRAVLEEAVEQEFLTKNPARKQVMPPTRSANAS